jgi:hypothetical protein
MPEIFDYDCVIDEEHVKFINIIKSHEFEFEYILKSDKKIAKLLYDTIIKLGES